MIPGLLSKQVGSNGVSIPKQVIQEEAHMVGTLGTIMISVWDILRFTNM